MCERKLAVQWGSSGSSRLSKLSKSQTAETRITRWWIEGFDKLSRLSASIAVLLGFMCVLVVITLVIFVLEAFLVILYRGPGSQLAVCTELFLSPARQVDDIVIACYTNDTLRR